MNKFKLSAVAILASLALTACGGGGGNNSNNQPKESTINQTGSTQPSMSQIDYPPLELGFKNSDKKITIDKNDYAIGSIKQSFKNSSGKETAKLVGENRQYTINGILVLNENKNAIQQLIDLGTGYSVNTDSNKSGLTGKGINEKLNTTFRGSLSGFNSLTFYQGYEPTSDVAISKMGKATYKGNAMRYDMLSARPRGIGETTLEADFANKTIEGKIVTEGHRRNITLQQTKLGTTDKGNTDTKETEQTLAKENEQTLAKEAEQALPLGVFQGTAIAEGNLIYPNDVKGTYRGQFFGPNAEEVGGLVSIGGETGEEGETPISFSAVKQ